MDEHIEELLAFYALDSATEADRELLEVYLAEHPEAKEEFEALRAAAEALPYSLSPVVPSDRPKNVLMSRVAADQRARLSSRTQNHSLSRGLLGWLRQGFPRAVLAGFSVLVAAAAILWGFWLNWEVSRLRVEVAELRSAVQTQQSSIAQVQAAVTQFRDELAQSSPEALMTVALQGTPARPQALGQLIADPGSRSALVLVAGLAPLTPGRIYQVWLIRGETPTSAGLFEVNDQGQGALLLNAEAAIGTFDTLGISIEPEPGSLQPTGEIVILSQLY